MTNYIRERAGGRKGGTAQRSLALPWIDTHLTHTLLHRVPVCVPLHSPGCQNLAVSSQEKTTKEPINKQTDKKRRTTHTLDPTGYNKKIKQKQNLEYKKSQCHRVLQKDFFSNWLLNSSTLFLLVYQVYTINLTRQLKSIQYCHFSYIYRYLYTIQSWQKYINKYIKLDCTHHNCVF